MMRRTEKVASLFAVYESRTQGIKVLHAITQGQGAPEPVAEAAAAMHQAATSLGNCRVGGQYEQFAKLLDVVSHLLRWGDAIRSAEIEADRHLRAARQGATDLIRQVGVDPEMESLSAVANKITALSDVYEVEQIAELSLHIPLPLPIFGMRPSPHGPNEFNLTTREEPQNPVALVSFSVNNTPFGDPHVIESEVIHDLTLDVRLSHWPELAEELIFDVVSVEPPGSYELPQFSFSRPDGDPPYRLRDTRRMLLRVPHAILARPLEFTYRGGFEPEECGVQVVVEGQRHLHAQSFDPDVNPQTGYQEVDRKLLEIRAQARLTPGINDKDLAPFLQVLAALGHIAGEALQDDLFEGVWTERQFQAEIRKRLRGWTWIGSELDEHPRASGGITDLSFRGIRMELKTLVNGLVTIKEADPYLNQTAQYVVGSDRRLGVLCLLDCSEKDTAPGSVGNDLALSLVPSPGGGDGMPILIGIVIIRGNLPMPSALSK